MIVFSRLSLDLDLWASAEHVLEVTTQRQYRETIATVPGIYTNVTLYQLDFPNLAFKYKQEIITILKCWWNFNLSQLYG